METFFSSLPCLSFTWQSKVTLHPSQFPWWGGGQCRYLGLLYNDFFFLFLVSYSLSSTDPCLLLFPCSDMGPWGNAVSQHSAIFSHDWVFPLFPHHILFHMCPLCLPSCVYCPVWKFFEHKYHVLLWPTVDLVCKGSLHPCQGWLIAAQRRKQAPTQGTWQLTAGQTLLVMPNKFHTLLQQTLSECLPITKLLWTSA